MADTSEDLPATGEGTEIRLPETAHVEAAPEGEGERQNPLDARAEAMARIAERYEREQRGHELEYARELAGAEPGSGDAGQGEATDGARQADAAGQQERPAGPAAVGPDRRVVEWQGQRVAVTEAEMTHLAQMGLAHAALLRQQQAMQQAQQFQQAPQIQAQAQPAAQVPAEAIDAEASRRIARAIMYGGEEEGSRAVQEMAAGIAQRMVQSQSAVSPDMVAQIAAHQAAQIVQRDRAEHAFHQDLNAVGAEFPEVFADRGLTLVAADALQHVREHYARLGVQKSNLDLYREAATIVKTRYLGGASQASQSAGETDPSVQAATQQRPGTTDRMERKRAAPRPPAAANRTASTGSEASRHPTASEIVNAMRKSRQQPTIN